MQSASGTRAPAPHNFNLTRCVFENNVARFADGIGVHAPLSRGSLVLVRNCVFRNQTCSSYMGDACDGGALSVGEASLAVYNTSFSNLTVSRFGGALVFDGRGSLLISNATFVNCKAAVSGSMMLSNALGAHQFISARADLTPGPARNEARSRAAVGGAPLTLSSCPRSCPSQLPQQYR